MILPPKRSPFKEPKLKEPEPRFWPGLLLNLLLPGSGYTCLDRPLLHLGMLALTLLVWLACWLLMLYVGYSGLAESTASAQAVAGGLTILAGLIVLGWYVVLTRLYIQTYRAVGQPGCVQKRVPLPLKLVLVGLQVAAPIWLVWQNPLI